MTSVGESATVQGVVVYLFAFDVANEVQTEKVAKVLGHSPVPFTVRTDHRFPRDITLYAPLAVELPPLRFSEGDRPVGVLVRVYEVGVVTVALRVDFTVGNLEELYAYHRPTLHDRRSLEAAARELCGHVREDIRHALLMPGPPTEPEAYTVFCLHDLGDELDTGDWLERERRTVAGLLAENDPRTISEEQVGESLRQRWSFEKSDLVVIDWDAALVVDFTAYHDDVLYMLELANLQLEEFRVMDQKLDRYLNRAYEDVDRRRFGLFGVASGMLRALRRFRVDVTKLTDEVSHITKFLGDWYLARIYVGARERFHLEQWRASVEARLSQLDQIYQVIHSDIYEQRMFWLEVIIVLLFLIDLVLIFLMK